METSKILEAEQEAIRFLDRVESYRKAISNYPNGEGSSVKTHAALRRAPINLTRALAEMRKP